MHGAGLGHVPPMSVLDHKSGPARLQLQAMPGKGAMHVLPGTRIFQHGQNAFALVARVALKRLSAGVRLHGCGPFTKALFLGLIPAVVDDKAVFLLQLPTELVAFDIVPPGLHARQLFRVDQIIRDVHVHVFRVDVDAAMPLMFR